MDLDNKKEPCNGKAPKMVRLTWEDIKKIDPTVGQKVEYCKMTKWDYFCNWLDVYGDAILFILIILTALFALIYMIIGLFRM